MPDPPYTPELEARLEAYFSSLRASPLRDVLKHASANWRLYAAVTGSALAMSHGAPLLAADADPALAEPAASVLPAHRNAASSRGNPLIERARQAILKASDQTAAPAIAPGGIAPIFGRAGTIQPGEWVTIYGTGLATGTFNWNGDFPVTLGGTSVTINNKPAYLMFVSPGQINLQAPDDTATGTVPVVVATPAGSTTVTVTLSEFAPAFSLIGQQDAVPHFVSGIILRPNGTGAYGNGSYDILGPGVKSFGFPNTPAEAGDSVEIYGVGFGPTTPAVPAGQVFSGAAPLNNPVTLYINGVVVPTTFAGLSSAGVVQINFTVPPGLGEGSVPIQALVGGMTTPNVAVFPLASYAGGGGTVVNQPGTGGGFVPTFGGSFLSGTMGGTVGGGGTGGGSYAVHRKGKRHHPRLRYPN